MNTCETCKDFKEIDTTKNNVRYGTCESESGAYNLDDVQNGGFAVIHERETKLAVTSGFGCVNYRKRAIEQNKLF